MVRIDWKGILFRQLYELISDFFFLRLELKLVNQMVSFLNLLFTKIRFYSNLLNKLWVVKEIN